MKNLWRNFQFPHLENTHIFFGEEFSVNLPCSRRIKRDSIHPDPQHVDWRTGHVVMSSFHSPLSLSGLLQKLNNIQNIVKW